MTVRGHVTEVVEAGPIGTARFWLQPKGDRKRLIVSNLDVKVSVGELLEVTGWEDPDGYVNAERIQNVPPPQPPEPVAPHPPRVEPERPPLPKPEPQSRRTSKLPKWVLVLGSLIIIAALGWWLLKSALKPTIGDTIRINPTSPVAGHRFTVALQLKRAQQVTLTPDATPSGQPGEYTFPQGLSDSTDLEVVATNIFGSTPKKFHIEVQPAPVGKKPSNVILSVNPLHVHRGDQVTIRWNALNADKVVLRGLGTEIELTPPSGGSLPHPIQQQTDLQLIASNSAGETPSRPVTVALDDSGSATEQAPEIQVFSTDPVRVTRGGAITLRWQVSNADTVNLSPVIGAVRPTDSRRITPASTTEYTLTATRRDKSVTRSIRVIVDNPQPPVIQALSVDPMRIKRGESIRIHWQVINAERVAISPGVGQVALTDTQTLKPTTTTTYTLTATGMGVDSKRVTVIVDEPQTPVEIKPHFDIRSVSCVLDRPPNFYKVEASGTAVVPGDALFFFSASVIRAGGGNFVRPDCANWGVRGVACTHAPGDNPMTSWKISYISVGVPTELGLGLGRDTPADRSLERSLSLNCK